MDATSLSALDGNINGSESRMAPSDVLKAEHISAGRQAVLEDINVEFDPGLIVAVVGEKGPLQSIDDGTLSLMIVHCHSQAPARLRS